MVEKQKRPDSLSRNKVTEWVAFQTRGYRIKMTWRLRVWKQLSVSPEHGKAGGPLACNELQAGLHYIASPITKEPTFLDAN